MKNTNQIVEIAHIEKFIILICSEVCIWLVLTVSFVAIVESYKIKDESIDKEKSLNLIRV